MLQFDINEFRSIPLPTEDDIMGRWSGNQSKPLVSIVCITYNQMMYIEDAIRGFLIQETDFPFEIIIHDDASTDSTPLIIGNYVKKYPKLIKAILQNENQYSKSPNSVLSIALKAASGEFLAICEGDDFWINNKKIEIQVKTMMKNQEVNLSFHTAIQHNCLTDDFDVIGQYGCAESIININEVILKSKGMIPTASTMISSRIVDEFVEVMSNLNAKVGDIYLHVISSLSGGALFINKSMSVYRLFSVNSFNSCALNNSKQSHEIYESRVDCFRSLSERYRSYGELFMAANRVVTKDFIRNKQIDLNYRKNAYMKNAIFLNKIDLLICKFILTCPSVFRLACKLLKPIKNAIKF